MAQVVTNHQGKPMIPGSALKGVIRAYLRDCLETAEAGESPHATNEAKPLADRLKGALKNLLGESAPQKANQVSNRFAGRLVCADAHWQKHDSNNTTSDAPTEAQKNLSYYSTSRATYVETGIALDRDTGTALDRHLFNIECVPAGHSFSTRWIFESHSQEQGQQDLEVLLAVLQDFQNTDAAISVGSDGAKGYGQLACTTTWKYFGETQFKQWANQGFVGAWTQHATPQQGNKTPSPLCLNAGRAEKWITLPITIAFEGAYLSNDPSKQRKGQSHNGRTTENGKPLLSTKSVQGALRAQAERILRTLGLPCQGLESTPLDVVLFGNTTQAGKIRQTTWTYVEGSGTEHTQDFVAIDRFTGGGQDGKKFNANGWYAPHFTGELKIPKDLPEAAKGLLLLVLRDFAEGDIRLGWGTRKGYGGCVATSESRALHLALTEIWGSQTDENNSEWLLMCLREPLKLDNSQCGYRTLLDEFANTNANTSPRSIRLVPDPKNEGDFHNPYHFAPIDGSRPDEWEDVKNLHQTSVHSHGKYFAGNPCIQGQEDLVFDGRIDCILTTVTPTFVGAKQKPRDKIQGTEAIHYSIPSRDQGTAEEEVALPATSIKGMIGSLMEAASGSALRVFEAYKTISYRLPADEPYILTKVGKIVEAPNTPTGLAILPLSNARFASLDDLRLSNGEIAKTLAASGRTFPERHRRAIIANPDITGQRVPITAEALAEFQGIADELTELSYKREVKRDPTILNRPNELALKITPYHLINFLVTGEATVNRCRERNANPSSENQIEPYRLVPKVGDWVYFDGMPGNMRFAYSSIWRRQVKKNRSDQKMPATWADFLPLEDAAKNNEICPFHSGRTKLSPVERLLGFVQDDTDTGLGSSSATHHASPVPQAKSLAGKLYFSDGVQVGQETHSGTKMISPEAGKLLALKLLGEPKPPSPALYFKFKSGWNNRFGGITKVKLEPRAHSLQGRKIYLHPWMELQNGTWNVKDCMCWSVPYTPWESKAGSEDPKNDKNAKMRLWVRPVPKNTQFEFSIRFNNLKLSELQLLCYGLAPHKDFIHRLGLAKSLGMGSVALNIKQLALIDRYARYAVDALDAERHFTSFEHLHHRLAEHYRNGRIGNGQAMAALDVLGSPGSITAPVHTPQLKDRDIEIDTYKWYVENDRVGVSKQPSREVGLGKPTKGAGGVTMDLRQSLREISAGTSSPTLKRDIQVVRK